MAIKLLKFVMLGFLLIFLSIGTNPVYSAEDWVAEEVFKQISELRRDNNKLRKEVDDLKKQVSQLGSNGRKNKRISQVSLDDDFKLGAEDSTAKVAIVEFSDFECPFCRRHITQTLPKLRENYIDKGKVQYVMRDFPLAFHRNAESAAVAANCAGQQDAYWQMHEKLFMTKGKKGKPLYVDLAKQLKLNENKFTACLDDPKQVKEIEADMEYGQSIGVSGTPAFFIGKYKDGSIVDARFISGAQPYTKFSQIIDSLIN